MAHTHTPTSLRGALLAPLLSVVLLGALLPALAGPAHAAPAREVVSTAKDARGDVRTKPPGRHGPSLRTQRRLDIWRATIGWDEASNRWTFTVRVKKLMRKKSRHDQMFWISVPSPTREESLTEVMFTHRGKRLAYATAGDNWCDLRRVVRENRRTITAYVPKRCVDLVPDARPRVRTLLGTFRSDAPVWSRDAVRLPRVPEGAPGVNGP